MANSQEITVTLRLNNSLTLVNCQTQDNLPTHIKGIAEFHHIRGIATRYYLPEQLSTQNIPEPVKFLNNTWYSDYGLVYITGQKQFFTHKDL